MNGVTALLHCIKVNILFMTDALMESGDLYISKLKGKTRYITYFMQGRIIKVGNAIAGFPSGRLHVCYPTYSSIIELQSWKIIKLAMAIYVDT